MQDTLAKKIFAVGSAVAMTVSLAIPFAAQAAAHGLGTNISTVDSAGNNTVWMVTSSGRRAYTSAGAFLSYGFNSWSGVVVASAEDLALPVDPAGFIPPQDGTIFCATATKGSDVSGECSLVTTGQKAAFTSAPVFAGLGFSFGRAQYGDSSFLSKTTNIDNTTAAHRPGVLVNNNGTVQLVGVSGLLGIPDVATFNSWGYSFANVVPANTADKAMTQTGVMATRTAGQLSPTALTVCTINCPVTPPISGPISVSLASDNPAAGTIVTGQATADLLHFVLTGNGTVSSIMLKRTGISDQSTLSNVYLYDGVTRLTDGYSFNSTGDITINGLNLSVSGSRTISVKADVFATANSGSTVQVAVSGLTVVGGTAGSTNIMGNLFTVASGTGVLASASFTAANTVVAASVNAGTTGYTFWSAPLQINTRTVWLKSANFRMVGSAPSDALANIKLFVDGVDTTLVGTVVSIQGSNYVLFNASAAPVSLTTGSHTLDVRADIQKGSSRTVQFSVQQAADLMVFDPQVGVNIAVTGTPNNAGQITIGSGSVTIVNDPTFQAITNVTGGASNVPIAKFKMHAYGEDVKVQTLTLTPTVTGSVGPVATAAATLNNVGGTATGTVTAIAITAGGTGYTAIPAVTFSPSAIQALATVALTGTPATTTTATVTNAGSGYTVAPAVTVVGGTCTVTPTATATVVNFAVTAVTFSASNCTVAPTVSIAAPLGVTATGTAVISGGAVTSITIGTGGTAYTNTPSITIAGPTTSNTLDQVTLYFNGSQVGTQQQFTGTALVFQLGSQLIVPAGTDSTLEVRSNIRSSGGTNFTSGTVQVTLNQGLNNAQGQSSFTSVNVPTANVVGNTLTIQTGLLAVSKSTGYADQNANPNGPVKLGSFVLQNQSSSESVRVTSLLVGLGGTCLTTNFAGLMTSETTGSGNVPVQPQTSNTFSVNFTLPTGQSKTIDILANSSSAVNCTAITTLTVTSIGVSSNVPATSAVITGQTITLQTGTLANLPTFLTASASTAQYVPAGNGGATDGTVASYNFVSTGGASTISELKFNVIASTGTPVTFVRVGTISQQPVNGVVYLTGLNLAVPNGGSGLSQDVFVSYSNVGTSGITPGTTAQIALSYVKYTSGGTTTTINPNVPAPMMTMVGSVPTLVISTTQSTGLSLSGVGKIGEVTISANAKGNIKVNQIVFTVNSSGFTSAPASVTGTVISSSNSSSNQITGSVCVPASLVVTCTFGVGTLTDFDGITVQPGTPITFSLFGQLGANTVVTGTPIVSSSIGAASFSWDDSSTNGGVGSTGLTGTLIYNFPNNSFSIRQ